MKNLSFGGRFAILSVCSTLLTVGLLAFVAYRELVADFEQVLTQRQQLEAQSYANRVNQRLQLRLSSLGALAAQMTDGTRLLPAETLARILQRQSLLADFFDIGLLVFDENAVAIAENQYVPGRLGTSYADRSHFREALASREPYISRPIIGRTTGVMLVSFLHPIKADDGRFLGFAGGSINLNNTALLPEPVAVTPNAVFKVLDTQNFTRVDAIEPDNLMPELPAPGESPLIDAALSGITSGVVEDSDGQRWIYATKHLERVGWLFLRAVPYEQATAPARASFQQFVAISGVLVLVMLALVLALSRITTAPLERMAARLRTMTRQMENPGRLAEIGAPEIRSLARAFNQLLEEREALDELKNQFVSNISHELRTPLTSINGSLTLLASNAAGPLPDKANRMVKVALRNSDQLQRLIGDLLDFNKALAGELAVKTQPVIPAEILAEAVSSNRALAEIHNIRLAQETAPDAQIMADPYRLKQILDNFISNACKFSPAGSTVTLSAHREGNLRVRLVVADQGEGVPELFLPRLFHRFAQAEAGSDRARAGTGLGLAICDQLATLMGGQVGYFYQRGAHFWVELPIAPTDQSENRDEDA